MAIDATGSSTGGAQTPATSKTDQAQSALTKDFGSFLKLLTTQLQNQDPTQPLDTNQITQQIAQLSSVEQQIATNKNLEKLIAASSSGQINNVVGYIGKRVEAEGNKSSLVNGLASFVYSLDTEATSANVSISDTAGNVVYTGNGNIKAGHNEVFWDGLNSFTGQQMADGTYTISVTAKDSTGADVKVTTFTTGRVTAVDIKDGQPVLEMGSLSLDLDKVLSIREDPLANYVNNGGDTPTDTTDDSNTSS